MIKKTIFIIICAVMLLLGCSDMGNKLDKVKEDMNGNGSVYILFDSTNTFVARDKNGDVFYCIVNDFNFTEPTIKVKQKLFNINDVNKK